MLSDCLPFITVGYRLHVVLTLPHLILTTMYLIRWVLFCFTDEDTGKGGQTSLCNFPKVIQHKEGREEC